MRATAIPMLNPYKISQSVKMLITQAERGPLQMKPKTTAPVAAPAGVGRVRASEYDIPPPINASTSTVSTDTTQIVTPAASGSGCPQCQTEIASNWYLCAYCGHKLRPLNCPGCSKEVNYAFKLCPFCGINLK